VVDRHGIFHNFGPDLGHFLLSVVINVSNLWTGGVIIASAWAWNTFYKPVTKRAWKYIALILLFFGFFHAWRDQARGFDEANNKLEALTVPHFSGYIVNKCRGCPKKLGKL
jgi:hypothetical protein